MTSTLTPDSKSRTILITGSTSGIGYQAALKILNAGNKLILPCRNELRSKYLFEKLVKDLNSDIDLLETSYFPVCDLADLNTIDHCMRDLFLRYECIDTLILNAGLQYTGAENPKWSSQGFELTFAVNHLGHHYLFERIEPLLCESNSPRIVITSSEVHNPQSPGGRIGQPAGLGSLLGMLEGKGFSMVDGISEFSADKAYKDSKLCNIIFAKEICKRLNQRGIFMPVIAWAPGLVIPRSNEGFFRYSRKYNELGQRLFTLIARDLFRITENPQVAGALLAKLATSNEYNDPIFSYFSNKVNGPGKRFFKKSVISSEASKDEIGKLLWENSIRLINNSIGQSNSKDI